MPSRPHDSRQMLPNSSENAFIMETEGKKDGLKGRMRPLTKVDAIRIDARVHRDPTLVRRCPALPCLLGL